MRFGLYIDRNSRYEFGSSRSLASGARAMRFDDELAQKWTREKSRRRGRRRSSSCTFVKI